jgi:hypothetical protein
MVPETISGNTVDVGVGEATSVSEAGSIAGLSLATLLHDAATTVKPISETINQNGFFNGINFASHNIR